MAVRAPEQPLWATHLSEAAVPPAVEHTHFEDIAKDSDEMWANAWHRVVLRKRGPGAAQWASLVWEAGTRPALQKGGFRARGLARRVLG